MPIAGLAFDQDNTRQHNEKSIAAIVASLEKFGQDQPIVVQKKGLVVRKGNGRLQAAKKLGWTHIAAVIVEEADLDATMRAIADNRSAELSNWDPRALGRAFEEAQKVQADYSSSVGFTQEEIARFIGFSSGFLDKVVDPVEGGQRQAAPVASAGQPEQPEPEPPLPENDNVSVIFLMSVEARREVTRVLNATKQEHGLETQSEALLHKLGLLNRKG